MNYLTKLLNIGLPLLVLTGCSETEMVTILHETRGVDRRDAPVILQRKDLPNYQTGYVPFLDSKQIPYQVDDLDGDGQWDEIAVLLDMSANQRAAITWEKIDKTVEFPRRTNIHIGWRPSGKGNFNSVNFNVRPADHVPQSKPYIYQFEGPGWESDLVAYRTYFDERNGKDIFGKVSGKVLLEEVGLEGNYHSLKDWGMDILKVGSSLGAGALALLKNDTIHRLGATASSTAEVIADGPVRAVLKLRYEGWLVSNRTYNLTETITIWGGQRWFQSEVLLEGAEGNESLVTGIVNFENLKPTSFEGHQFVFKGIHGKISENSDHLGMSIISSKGHGMVDMPYQSPGDIENTSFFFLKASKKTFSFYFHSGWELENRQFADSLGYFSHVSNVAESLYYPIELVN